MPETLTIPEVLTLDDAAHFLKLSPEAVARQAEAGYIPGRQVEGSWRFLLSRLEEWLGQRDSKAIFLAQAGAFQDDESMDELVAEIYKARLEMTATLTPSAPPLPASAGADPAEAGRDPG